MDFEPLPEHLEVLLEEDCEDVLVDSICQRAYNLTFNRSTTHKAIGSSDGMDGVVEDFAIRSPLDAVSAWYSSLLLQRAFGTSLNSNASPQQYVEMTKDIDVALKTAPIGSNAQVRALVARAVLVNEKRGANIAALIQILSPEVKGEQKQEHTLINATTSLSSLPDLRMSLKCAMAIAHLSRPGTPAPASYMLINAIQPARMTLLGFASSFKLMETLAAHEEASMTCSRALENLAGNLRIWVGTGGKEGGAQLPMSLRKGVTEKCLGITKSLVGMGLEKDAGYETMTEEEIGDGC